MMNTLANLKLNKLPGRLRGLIAERNMSISTLSERLGVHRTTVASWLCGLSVPQLEHLLSLAEAFDIGLDEFFE